MPQRLPTGVLVAFEGIDGSGKTTQAEFLTGQLEQSGLAVVRTKEPTSGPWGQKIRQSKFERRLEPAEELKTFINDRKQHVADLIKPKLETGHVVIVDRYYYSTVAYQGARGMDWRQLLEQNRAFAPIPDLLVLLDIDPLVGLKRIKSRGNGQDLFEDLDSLRRARAIFNALDDPHILRLDGERDRRSIHVDIIDEIRRGPLSEFSDWARKETYSYVDLGTTRSSDEAAAEIARRAEKLAADSSVDPTRATAEVAEVARKYH